MLTDIVDVLLCPQCGRNFALVGDALRCPTGHAFDVAREGYVNLLPGGAAGSTADTRAMVRARQAFLESGHFVPVAEAVVHAARDAVPGDVDGVFLDAGAGTGFMLSALLEATPARIGVALDISKHAIRVAARSHDRIGAFVADVWAPLPLHDACAALVLNVFAPRNAEEFARVLTPGGALLVVTPRDEHLIELVEPLGLVTVDPRKRERLSAKLDPFFEHIAERVVSGRLELSHADAIAAVSMGPSAAHVSAEQITARMRALSDPVEVTLSVTVDTYRPRRIRAVVS